MPAIDANVASVNSRAMPGSVTTTRTATNVTSRIVRYRATPTAPAGASISVSPRSIVLDPGESVDLTITISWPGLSPGQYFGDIALDEREGDRDLHLPVAFARGQGDLSLTQACAPTTITRPDGRSTCTVTMQNNTRTATTLQATTHVDSGLRVAG
ncbi:MAG: Fn3-like domain-containing protein, partial [Acidimicrobiia bacterium]